MFLQLVLSRLYVGNENEWVLSEDNSEENRTIHDVTSVKYQLSEVLDYRYSAHIKNDKSTDCVFKICL